MVSHLPIYSKISYSMYCNSKQNGIDWINWIEDNFKSLYFCHVLPTFISALTPTKQISYVSIAKFVTGFRMVIFPIWCKRAMRKVNGKFAGWVVTNANNAPGTRGNPSNLGTMRLLHCLICRKWVIFMSFLSTLLGIFFFGTLFGGSWESYPFNWLLHNLENARHVGPGNVAIKFWKTVTKVPMCKGSPNRQSVGRPINPYSSHSNV